MHQVEVAAIKVRVKLGRCAADVARTTEESKVAASAQLTDAVWWLLGRT